jgi:hypothetical protein
VLRSLITVLALMYTLIGPRLIGRATLRTPMAAI